MLTRPWPRAFIAIAAGAGITVGATLMASSGTKPTAHRSPPAVTTTIPRPTTTTTSTTAPPSESPPSAPPQVPVPPATVRPPAPVVHIVLTGVTTAMVQAKFGIPQTGVWDDTTQQATLRFQASQRIAVDGIVGPVTWGRLNPPPAGVKPVAANQSVSTCDAAMSVVNAHGLYLQAGWRFICPGQALTGAHVTGTGHNAGDCPCTTVRAVTVFGNGPEGAGPYISIRRAGDTYAVAYEICNSILGIAPDGNSHDRVSGGSLSPSTAQCVASHGL